MHVIACGVDVRDETIDRAVVVGDDVGSITSENGELAQVLRQAHAVI
jgi:hypothetical protein